jgi:hypothetical protein
VGDQIYLKGALVNYESDKYGTRQTSTTRRDLGNQACEVVLVDELEILEREMFYLAEIWDFKSLITFLIVLPRVLLFALESLIGQWQWRKYQRGKRED